MAQDQKEITERIKAHMKIMTLDYEIDRYEKRAREILSEAGYPIEWEQLRARLAEEAAAPQRVREAEDMLLRARNTREYAEKNDAKSAAWNAILMTRAAMRADLPQYDKALVSEYQHSNAKKRGEGPLKRTIRDIIKGGILNYADVLDELRKMAERVHPIVREVADDEQRVYYVGARDKKGEILNMPSIKHKTIKNLIAEIKAEKS